MRIALFSNTGMGNMVLDAVYGIPFLNDILVFTRKEKGEFPYFEISPLQDVCKSIGISYCDETEKNFVERQCLDFRPDLVICATYNHLLGDSLLNCAREAINLHPSLLPELGGPTPTNWSILLGHTQSGVTAHRMTGEFDSGDVIGSEIYEIPANVTDGQLRQSLYRIAGNMAMEMVEKFASDNMTIVDTPQQTASYYPHAWSEKGLAEIRKMGIEKERVIRAFTPFPGGEYTEKVFQNEL